MGARARQADAQGGDGRSCGRRRDLGRAEGSRQVARGVVAAADPRSRRRPHCHGPAHGTRAGGGRRLLVRDQSVRPRAAGPPAARLLVQTARLCRRPRQRLQADLDRARCADRGGSGPRQGSVDAEELRRRVRHGAVHAAAGHREVAQPDDGAAGAGHGYAADRRVRAPLRRLRRHAAGAVDVARRGRDDARAHGRRLRRARQRRTPGAAHAHRPHPGPLGAYHLAARQARVRELQGREVGQPGRAGHAGRAAADHRPAYRLPDDLDHGRRDPARYRHGHFEDAAGCADRRQDRHQQRRKGRVVRRLYARPRGGRVHRLRHAAADGQGHDGRACGGAHLRQLPEAGARRQEGGALPRAARHQARARELAHGPARRRRRDRYGDGSLQAQRGARRRLFRHRLHERERRLSDQRAARYAAQPRLGSQRLLTAQRPQSHCGRRCVDRCVCRFT